MGLVLNTLGFATTSAGTSGPALLALITNVFHSYGSSIAVWDCSDPTAITLTSTTAITDILSFGRFGAGSPTSPFVAVCSGEVSLWEGTFDGPFVPATVYTAGPVPITPGTNAVGMQTGFASGCVFFADGSDIALIRLNKVVAVDPSRYVTPASVPFGAVIAGLTHDGNDFTYGCGGTIVKAFTFTEDATVPPIITFTTEWTAATAEGSARGVKSNGTIIGVVTGSGATSGVEIFDCLTGASVGVYTNAVGGTVVDFEFYTPDFINYHLIVITDAATDNGHIVDIADPTTPVFVSSTTIPDTGHTLAHIDIGESSGSGSKFLVTSNVTAGNAASVAVIEIAEATAGGGPPVPSPWNFVACFAVGSYLYALETTNPALQIYDIGDPANPSLSGFVVLSAPPTAIAVDRSAAYVAYSGRLDVINIDDPAAPTIFKTYTATGAWTHVSVVTGMAFLSGPTANLTIVDTTQDPTDAAPVVLDTQEAPNTGFSSVAVSGTKILVADAGDPGHIRRYDFGGFSCDLIRTGAIAADEIQVETINARHGHFAGDVVARNVQVAAGGSDEDGILAVSTRIHMGTDSKDAHILAGTQLPENNVTAPIGSLYLYTSGGAGATLWVKESGADTDTGWIAK